MLVFLPYIHVSVTDQNGFCVLACVYIEDHVVQGEEA